MTPDETLMLREMWSDYRRARRRNKGRWLSASRDAARRVRMMARIYRVVVERWASEWKKAA